MNKAEVRRCNRGGFPTPDFGFEIHPLHVWFESKEVDAIKGHLEALWPVNKNTEVSYMEGRLNGRSRFQYLKTCIHHDVQYEMQIRPVVEVGDREIKGCYCAAENIIFLLF